MAVQAAVFFKIYHIPSYRSKLPQSFRTHKHFYAAFKSITRCLQGMGVRITHKDVLTSAFGEAIRKVLQKPSYRVAAGLISRKLRARKRTPVQEAAGVLAIL